MTAATLMVLVMVIPFLGGLVAACPYLRGTRGPGLVSVVASGLTLAAATMGLGASPSTASWGPMAFRLDGLSATVLLACALFGLLVSVYSLPYMAGRPRAPTYYVFLLWTLAAAGTAVLADDLLVLLAAWGFLAFTLYIMAGLTGPAAAATAKKTFIIVGGSDCLFMLGVALVWARTGDTALLPAAAIPLDTGTAWAAFLCFVTAALAKAGAMPFHGWVPDFGEHAHPPASAFLPASLDKLLGIYLLARTTTVLFQPVPGALNLLMLIGAATVVCAVLSALVQHDLKRLLAWHAVSQVGYMVLGIGTGTALGLAGGLFHMLNHTLYKSCLFLSAGAIERQAGTTDLDRLGGLGRLMPLTFGATLVSALAISGVPPLNGFASKWMIYQGIVETGNSMGPLWVVWLTAAMVGSALTLASFVKVLHAAFLAKPSPGVLERSVKEAPLAMSIPMAVLASLCILCGVAAHALPVRYLVRPAVPDLGAYAGVWWSGPATGLLLAALAGGALVYWMTMRRAGMRTCSTYVGGEDLGATHVSGTRAKLLEVTGVDFFNTVRDLPGLRAAYRAGSGGLLDLYASSRKTLFYLIEWLRKAHTGVLPTYVLWLLAGVIAIVYVLLITER